MYTSSEYLGQVRTSRTSGQGQGQGAKSGSCKRNFAGGLPSTERQSSADFLYSMAFVIVY